MWHYPLVHMGVFAFMCCLTLGVFFLTEMCEPHKERYNWVIVVDDWLMWLGTACVIVTFFSLALMTFTFLLIFVNGLVSPPWWEECL